MYDYDDCDQKEPTRTDKTLRTLTLEESIQQQLTKANAEVKRLEELSRLLRNNPEVNRILELMGKRHL